MDIRGLRAYVDQSINGWAHGLTFPEPQQEMDKQAELRKSAVERGLRPGTPAFTNWVQDQFERWGTHLVRIERPAIKKKFNRYVQNLDGVFSSLGFYVESSTAEARFLLRLDVVR